jgi:hypothetical protein
LLLLKVLVGKVFDPPRAYTPPPASAVSGPFVTADASPAGVAAGCPVPEKYDATYVVPAVIATGAEKSSSCHPLADSPVNVPLASNWPVDDHRLPICAPVLSEYL